MKAIVFTLDAIFSLFVAATGISLLTYFVYAPQIPYALQYSSASSFISSLASTKISQLSSIALAQAITQQGYASNQTWPFLLQNPQNSAGNPTGPQYLTLAYAVQATSPSAPIVPGTLMADYGNIYFAAGPKAYAANATTGNIIWTATAPSNSIYSGAPSINSTILYRGMYIYDNGANVTALSAYNGSQIWSVNSMYNYVSPGPKVAEPNGAEGITKMYIMNGLLVLGTNAIGFSTGVGLYALSPNNGTVASVSSYVPHAQYTAGAGSQIAVGSNSSSLSLLTGLKNFSSSGAQIWNLAMPVSSDISIYGNTLAFYSGTQAVLASISGNIIKTMALPYTSGVSSYKGRIIFLSKGAGLGQITALNGTGATLWTANVPSSYTLLGNSTPIQSSQYVYSLWGSTLVVQNASSGAMISNVVLPAYPPGTPPSMILAYGKLFVSDASSLMAIGTCPINPNDSVLSGAASQYVNGQGSCATYLLSQIQPNSNYSFTINNVSRLNAASFTGGTNYILIPNPALSQLTTYTVSMWINLNSFAAQPALYSDYNLNGEKLYVTNGGVASSYIWNGASDSVASSTTPLSVNRWYLITQTVYYNPISGTTQHSIWVNGAEQATTTFTGHVATGTTGVVVGSLWGQYQYFNGEIADVQIYNTTLSATQINSLYHEGIAAPPVSYKNLTAWLPLEGDANSYASTYTAGIPIGSTSFTNVAYNSTTLTNSYSISSQTVPLPIFNYTSGTYKLYTVGAYSWR